MFPSCAYSPIVECMTGLLFIMNQNMIVSQSLPFLNAGIIVLSKILSSKAARYGISSIYFLGKNSGRKTGILKALIRPLDASTIDNDNKGKGMTDVDGDEDIVLLNNLRRLCQHCSQVRTVSIILTRSKGARHSTRFEL